MSLIGLCGRAGSGKDFLADELVRELGFIKVAFGTQLKVVANLIYPWVELDYAHDKKEVVIEDPDNHLNKTPRDVWLHLNKLRDIDNNVFCRVTRIKIESLIADGQNVVVTDIRKQNELDLLHKLKFTTIKVKNPIFNSNRIEAENILDTFKCDYQFYNQQNIGLQKWTDVYTKILLLDSNIKQFNLNTDAI
jgi:hypothetical protein